MAAGQGRRGTARAVVTVESVRGRADAAALDERAFVDIARALADPTRVQILRTVASSSSLCCGDIGREVPVRPATVSHHLRVLAQAGLVEMQRDGQFIHVRVHAGRLEQFREALKHLALAAATGPLTLRRPATGRRP